MYFFTKYTMHVHVHVIYGKLWPPALSLHLCQHKSRDIQSYGSFKYSHGNEYFLKLSHAKINISINDAITVKFS